MLTKALIAFAMTGALWVSGDAAFQKVGCPLQFFQCGSSPSNCCGVLTTPVSSDCCSAGADCCDPPSECCTTAVKTKKSCCDE